MDHTSSYYSKSPINRSRRELPILEENAAGKVMGQLETRTSRNVVIVATANKLARIAWAVLASGNNYHPLHAAGFSN